MKVPGRFALHTPHDTASSPKRVNITAINGFSADMSFSNLLSPKGSVHGSKKGKQGKSPGEGVKKFALTRLI